ASHLPSRSSSTMRRSAGMTRSSTKARTFCRSEASGSGSSKFIRSPSLDLQGGVEGGVDHGQGVLEVVLEGRRGAREVLGGERPRPQLLRQRRVERLDVAVAPAQQFAQPLKLRALPLRLAAELVGQGGGQVRGDQHPERQLLVLHRRLEVRDEELRQRLQQRGFVRALQHVRPPARSGGALRTPSPPPAARWRSAPGPTPRRRGSAPPASRCPPPSARSPSPP